MTPEQRLARVERILVRLATRGRKTRSEFRDRINVLIDAQIQCEEVFRDKINILIDAQIRNQEAWRIESHAINEQIKATDEQIKNVALAQVELTKSQKLTDRALRDFIKSLRQSRNGS